MLEVDAVLVLPHADQLGLHVLESRDPAGERRQLDEDHVARADEDARDEIDPLLRAARDQQLFEAGPDAARPRARRAPLEQRRVAPRRSVLQVSASAVEQLRCEMSRSSSHGNSAGSGYPARTTPCPSIARRPCPCAGWRTQ